jgi:hypothetical protein
MLTSTGHAARIADIRARITETASRLSARLEAAAAIQPPPGAWSAAQIGAHVALVNENLAAAIDGRSGAAVPRSPHFTERDWPDIARGVPDRNQAPSRFVPPEQVSIAAGLGELRQSVDRLHDAVAALSAERGDGYTITNRVVGTITLYQAADFAIAHMIRHNQQAKRLADRTPA